mgnify:CR=1 FL=1
MKPEYGYSLFQGSKPSQAYHELFIQENYNSNPEIILHVNTIRHSEVRTMFPV